MYNTCADRGSWLKEKERSSCFSTGRRVFRAVSGYTFAFAFALFRLHFAVRSIAAVLRSFGRLPITGSRPSDSPRVIINIDRASRDLAYFFYHLPVERIAWAFPYAPPGLYTQLCWNAFDQRLKTFCFVPCWSVLGRFACRFRPGLKSQGATIHPHTWLQ